MKVDRITHSRDMVIRNFPRWRPFDPPTSKTLPRTKHEADRMTRCRDMAVRSFPKCEVGRSVLNIYIVLMYSSSLRLEPSARGVVSKFIISIAAIAPLDYTIKNRIHV